MICMLNCGMPARDLWLMFLAQGIRCSTFLKVTWNRLKLAWTGCLHRLLCFQRGQVQIMELLNICIRKLMHALLARDSHHLIKAHMVDSQSLSDMLMNAFLLWTCFRNHLHRNWWQRTCMGQNGHPKRHLLTSGWSTFVNAKKLVAGDACIFLRGENGELYVGVRRATKPQTNISTSVIWSQHATWHTCECLPCHFYWNHVYCVLPSLDKSC